MPSFHRAQADFAIPPKRAQASVSSIYQWRNKSTVVRASAAASSSVIAGPSHALAANASNSAGDWRRNPMFLAEERTIRRDIYQGTVGKLG